MWQVVMLLAVAGSGIAQGRNSTSITSSSAAPSSTATAPTTSPTSASSSGTPKTTVITRDPIPVNYYPSRRERPPKDKEESSVRIPTGGSPKPTKYHYYPHNQHIYLLPECAVQQVCNAVYVRLNYTQPLCACPSRYREPCSASLNSDDLHTTELSASPYGKVFTLVKTCEPVADMRLCRAPRDWSLLALQNIRTGKSHYLVICRCPYTSTLEGPMSHDQPTYASVPGIRVYGMMCISKNFTPSTTPLSITKRKSRPLRVARSLRFTNYDVPFPWGKVKELMKSTEV